MILWDQARREKSATAARSGGAAGVASRRANTAKRRTKLLPGLISDSVTMRKIGKINLCTTVTNSPQEKIINKINRKASFWLAYMGQSYFFS